MYKCVSCRIGKFRAFKHVVERCGIYIRFILSFPSEKVKSEQGRVGCRDHKLSSSALCTGNDLSVIAKTLDNMTISIKSSLSRKKTFAATRFMRCKVVGNGIV
jgi:hypothetical protein